MKELLIKIQRDIKKWHKREPENIALVCVDKKKLRKLNRLIEEKLMEEKK